MGNHDGCARVLRSDMSLRFSPALLLVLSIGLAATSARADDQPFTFASVEAMASRLASEPYKDVPSIDGDMKKLSYDHYRALRTKPDTALWRDTKSPFRVEFFPAGFIYEKPVQIGIVDDGKASLVTVSPDQFDFSDTGLKEPPKSLSLAGFKITNQINLPNKFDELAAFLGASYFRAIGRGQAYGSSARGIAINTATDQQEQFPAFRSFWIVKPKDDANDITVWALLDSPDVTGAYSFVLRPGARTAIDCHVVLFVRNDVKLLGVAPLTSMYFAGKSSPPRDDYRPEIHDADGLYMSTGGGERIWRPLHNPGALAVSSLGDNNPKGFGLLQRERDFEQYQDTAGKLEARPGLWVEPSGNWGEGEVRLVEIPSQAETNDNIVAFWVFKGQARKGERRELNYRLSALADEAALSSNGRVISTREGAVPSAPKQRRFAIEFAGGELDSLDPQQPVETNVSVSSGKLARIYVEPLPQRKSWRLMLEVEPDGKKPMDMRAALTLHHQTLTETWSYVWQP